MILNLISMHAHGMKPRGGKSEKIHTITNSINTFTPVIKCSSKEFEQQEGWSLFYGMDQNAMEQFRDIILRNGTGSNMCAITLLTTKYCIVH